MGLSLLAQELSQSRHGFTAQPRSVIVWVAVAVVQLHFLCLEAQYNEKTFKYLHTIASSTLRTPTSFG